MISQTKANQSSERNFSVPELFLNLVAISLAFQKACYFKRKKKKPTLQNTYITNLYVLDITGQCIYSDSKVKILFFLLLSDVQ